MRIFIASAADVLTDHALHGEGLIAWQTASAIAERGHELVLCARHVDLRTEPGFEIVKIGSALRFESLEPLAYARRVRQVLADRGGAKAFDAVLWLFPQEPLCFVPPIGVNFVIGPRSSGWPETHRARRPRRLGDLVRILASPVFSLLRRRSFARATCILVSTPSAVDELPSRHRSRAEVRSFGVDSGRFRQEPLPQIPTVLYVGRLDPQKRVTTLVEAFATVRRAVPAARLVFAGDGPCQAQIEMRCAELGLSSVVTLLGRVSHDEIPRLMGECSVLCLPSVGEPFGMVVLEAMASGRAVVASAAGGPAWLIEAGSGGSLVSHTSSEDWAAALIDVLSDRVRLEAMGRINRRRVDSEFSLARLVDALERAFAAGTTNARELDRVGLVEAAE